MGTPAEQIERLQEKLAKFDYEINTLAQELVEKQTKVLSEYQDKLAHLTKERQEILDEIAELS